MLGEVGQQRLDIGHDGFELAEKRLHEPVFEHWRTIGTELTVPGMPKTTPRISKKNAMPVLCELGGSVDYDVAVRCGI